MRSAWATHVGAQAVAEYRLHLFDEHGRFMRAVAIEAADDDDAIMRAWKHADRSERELWGAAGLIAKFASDPAS
jgi:hypothetical protein